MRENRYVGTVKALAGPRPAWEINKATGLLWRKSGNGLYLFPGAVDRGWFGPEPARICLAPDRGIGAHARAQGHYFGP